MLVELEALLVVELEMLERELTVQSMEEDNPELLLDVMEPEEATITLLTDVMFAGS